MDPDFSAPKIGKEEQEREAGLCLARMLGGYGNRYSSADTLKRIRANLWSETRFGSTGSDAIREP